MPARPPLRAAAAAVHGSDRDATTTMHVMLVIISAAYAHYFGDVTLVMPEVIVKELA